MDLSIKTYLRYATTQPCDVLLQIEALNDSVQTCSDTQITFDDQSKEHAIDTLPDMGPRRWVQAGPMFECRYETQVTLDRRAQALDSLQETPRVNIPAAAIPYLMPSRYCHSDQFLNFVAGQFEGLTGGALVSAINGWIGDNFTYDSNASTIGATATDTFFSLAGVCRDYAHVMIALARAGGIPARFVSAYAPGVTPPDFHAVVEVFLDGGWHLVDPTGMASANDTVRICVGRDAADASFMTSYGWMDLQEQRVEVTQIGRDATA
ncbi:MAG: transglutaminase family protein [Roseobacter sp.]